ncbi:hypothetical protein TSTA_028910 [Talaromyces stipitatus ATCC 10500]|uniref:Uncharacterized protein n=1 Tax=Talaromyces stipitatus (strain ATCC 10500 / CBS 375.48 / QM 6759 / NRRL 1006) TaxID=441959 RepID=B8M503_TALSN|nr:uncharacterized protein TSTA_028910 [Talaromyces stipitatus ATCC 10500]EED19609.1 hypothetical protein TSTA_028910 [Talaromyces stipitatus ATCC 10500]
MLVTTKALMTLPETLFFQVYPPRWGLQSSTYQTTTKAQRQYWRDKLITAAQTKEVFDISKWHKSVGLYRSPPLKDPLRPNEPPAVSTQEKRDLLVCNVLQNTAEAGDIPLDCPAAPSAALLFPEISIEQVEKAILKAGNTAPGEDELQTNILKVA